MVDKIRPGITLLEVMISILIVSVSVFGLLALLPVAGQQAQRGLDKDFAAIAGRNAVAEFNAREMARGLTDVAGNTVAPHWCVDSNPALVTLVFGRSYCIDPMYVTRHPSQGFPDVAGVPQMQRMNLRAGEWPARQATVPDFDVSPVPPNPGPYQFAPSASQFHLVPSSIPNSPPAAMSQQMADYVFTARDDVVFDKNEDQGNPNDPSAPLLPLQQWVRDGSGEEVMRETEAGYSWMATIVPRPQSGTSEYLLNIAVFKDRPLTASQDRVVQTTLTGQGISGGDMDILPRAGQPASDTHLRKDQWVLLTGSGSYFRWYRVIYAELNDDDPSGLRSVTLEGPDWPTALTTTPLMVIPPNVIACFQRTVRFGEQAVSN